MPRRQGRAGPGAILGALPRARALLGRYLSIRSKLTLWYGGVCAVTLVAAGVVMYLSIGGQLSSQIDHALVNSARRVNRELGRPVAAEGVAWNGRTWTGNVRIPGGSNIAVSASSSPTCATVPFSATYPHELVVALANFVAYCTYAQYVLDRDSQRVSSPGTFEQVDIDCPQLTQATGTYAPCFYISLSPNGRTPVPDWLNSPTQFTLRSKIAAGTVPSYFDTTLSQKQELRAYLLTLNIPTRFRTFQMRGVLYAFQNKKAYIDVENTIGFTLLVGIPIGLLVALAAGWWIARAALRPIGRISRTVRAIGEAQDLGKRIDFVGPEDEVGRLAHTFDHMMDRLEQVFDTQKRFIADASHELRTPLTTIRGNADLMRRAPANERDACLTAIRKEAERMSRLINDLLLLAEADVGDQPIHARPVDLDDVVLDVYRSAQLIADGRVEVVLEHADHIVVDGDSDRLKQLMLNLMDNAIKFTPEGGTVSLGAYRDRTQARIVVSDSGIGIPKENQEAIFQRFFRVEQSRSTRGSGLGLPIVAWIVQAHGGTIDLNSAPGKGTTFTVKLPLPASSPEVYAAAV